MRNRLDDTDLLPPERLLLGLAKPTLSDDQRREVRGLIESDQFPWTDALHQAKEQKIAPLVAQHLLLSDLRPLVPGEIRSQLMKARASATVRNALYAKALAKPLTQLAEERIRVVLMKGAMLEATSLSPPGTRALGDVDAIVRREDYHRVAEVLLQHGFYKRINPHLGTEEYALENYHELGFSFAAGQTRLDVDIHWLFDPPDCPYQLAVSELHAHARPGKLGNTPVWVTSREDTLIQWATQITTDRLSVTLCRINDIHVLVRGGLDWDGLVKRARIAGASGVTHLGLSLAATLGATVPSQVLARLARAAPGCATATDILTDARLVFSRQAPRLSTQLVVLPLLYERLGQRLAYVARLPFPTKHRRPTIHVLRADTGYGKLPGPALLRRLLILGRTVIAATVIATIWAGGKRIPRFLQARLRDSLWKPFVEEPSRVNEAS